MAYYFRSATAFWLEFIPYFVILNGILFHVKHLFLYKLMNLKGNKKISCLVFLLLGYLMSAVCIELGIAQPAQRLADFFFIFIFGCLSVAIGSKSADDGGNKRRMAQKWEDILSALTAAVLSVTVFTLSDGIVGPVSHLLPIVGGSFFAVELILLAVLTALLPTAAFYLISSYFKINQANNRRYLFVLLLPLILLIFLSQTIFDIGYTSEILVENGRVVSIFNDGQILLIFSLAFICLFVILYSFKRLTEQIELSETRVLLESRLKAQDASLKEAEMRYKSTCAFRHDLNNHIGVLKGLLESDNIQNAAEYLERFEAAADKLSYQTKTGNAPLDALLSEKLSLAEQSGITVTIDVDIPKNIPIDDFDLCGIFANALDNAIAACNLLTDEEKLIDIKAKRNRDFLLIDIINSCSNSEKTVLVYGTGLQNVKAGCEKYGGTIHLEQQSNRFIFTVLLPLLF